MSGGGQPLGADGERAALTAEPLAWAGAEVTDEALAAMNARAEAMEPAALLAWALDSLGEEVALASSFGAEDMVLLDVLARLRGPAARVFGLDTGRLPQQTYDVMSAVRRKYGIEVVLYFPEASAVEALVNRHGPNLFYDSVEDRQRCCHVRKVQPLGRALAGLRGWITGQRRDQSVTRTATQGIERDLAHGLWKLNPLAAWTSEAVWAYLRAQGVPYNRLHDQGYRSIGCAPCTRAVEPGSPERSGRWWWEDPSRKECGLHFASPKG